MFNKMIKEPSLTPIVNHQKKMSEQAAQAAQYVHDLETKLITVETELNAVNVQIELLNGANKLLHQDVEKARYERDQYHNRCVQIETRLGSVGTLILDALNSKPTEPVVSEYAPTQLSNVLTELEKEITAPFAKEKPIVWSKEKPKPIPEFLNSPKGWGVAQIENIK